MQMNFLYDTMLLFYADQYNKTWAARCQVWKQRATTWRNIARAGTSKDVGACVCQGSLAVCTRRRGRPVCWWHWCKRLS